MILNKEKDQQAKKKEKRCKIVPKKDLEDKCFGTSQEINFLRSIASNSLYFAIKPIPF